MEQIERWLVHRGVPQAIFHYNASEDVFTRMVPYLVSIFLLGSLAAFGDRFTGWAQFGVALAAFAVLGVLAVGVNRLQGRRPFELPHTIGVIEILLFLAGAPIVALLFGGAGGTGWWQLLTLNIVLFIVGYVVTTYGLVPMMRWGFREVGVQLRGVAALLAKLLPLLLLFATFLFLNAEVWQVAHGLTAPFFALTVAMMLVPALAFLVLRSPSEVAGLHAFASWSEIDEICAGTDAPLIPRVDSFNVARVDSFNVDGAAPVPPDLVPLDRGESRNLVLLMLIAQIVQIMLVALVIGGFYVVFGLLTVREETILQWTELDAAGFNPLARFSLFGDELVLTWELFAVSGLIATVSALQFAVSVATDELYREQFAESLDAEIRQVLAVRARYLEPMVRQARASEQVI